MLHASRNFLKSDLISLTNISELGKSKTSPVESDLSDSFDLSTGLNSYDNNFLEQRSPNLNVDDLDYRDALKERSGNSFSPDNKEDVCAVTGYFGNDFVEAKRIKHDTRVEEATGKKVNIDHKSKIANGIEYGRTGRKQKTFTKKSQRSMRNQLSMINLDKLKGKNRPLFVVLTMGDDAGGKEIKDGLNRLKRCFADHPDYKEFTGMWKLEFQENGKEHIHILLMGHPFLDHNWLAEKWHECLYRDPVIRKKNKDHLDAGTSVGKVHGISRKEMSKEAFKEGQQEIREQKFKKLEGKHGAYKKIMNYLTKYVTKMEDNVPDDWDSGGFWGYWNLKKFRTLQDPYEVEVTKEQYEDLNKARNRKRNNKRRDQVKADPNMNFIIKEERRESPVKRLAGEEVTEVTDGNGKLVGKLDESYCGNTSDGRRYIGGGNGRFKIYSNEEDGSQEYVTERISKVYTPGSTGDDDVFVGTLVEERTDRVTDPNKTVTEAEYDALKEEAESDGTYRSLTFDSTNNIEFITTDNGVLVRKKCPDFGIDHWDFEVNYDSKFLLINKDGEVIAEYDKFKDFDGLVLENEEKIYENWSLYDMDFEELLVEAFPDCKFELVGKFVTSFNKDNSIKQEVFKCKLVIYNKQEETLAIAS